MDDGDMAKAWADQQVDDALAEHRRRSHPSPSGRGAEGGGTCTDCGDAIPARRLQVAPGCTRCIGCQEEFERQLKRGF